MSFRVQMFHAESGFFLNTNHELNDLEDMKALINSGIFDKFRYRVVDETRAEVRLDREPHGKRDVPTIEDIASAFKAPIYRRLDDAPIPGWTDPSDPPD